MFCSDVLPCEYTSKKIPYCCNVKSAHDKGHQNDRGKREIGCYRSSLNSSSYEPGWIQKIQEKLQALEQSFSKELRNKTPLQGQTPSNPRSDPEISASLEAKVVSQLHKEILGDFFSQMKSSKDFISCVSCFRCLMATPEHALECGHVLCEPCVRDIGNDQDDLVVIVERCPLHRGNRRMLWEIARKPEFAGLRILSLDG